MYSMQKKTRILHVVGGMDRGGVETWLMNVLRNIDRERYHFDFLVGTAKPCAYDKEVEQFNSRIIPCLNPHSPCLYTRNFFKIIKIYGPYDIIHSHVHHFSGYNLLLAKLSGIPVRICHSHSDNRLSEGKRGILRSSYLKVTETMIHRFSTHGFFCSQMAGESLYGRKWNRSAKYELLYCGIDFSPYKNPVNRLLRQDLGISDQSLVIGHVGRFSTPKNHKFLIDIFSEVYKQVPSAFLLLIGDGNLRKEIELRANHLGLRERVIFTGLRADIAELLKGAIDVYCFPSLWEGLPVTVIEAQAAGLPCLISDCITNEVCVLNDRVEQLSLKCTAKQWADRLIAMHNHSPKQSLNENEFMKLKQFNIKESIAHLCEVYDECIY